MNQIENTKAPNTPGSNKRRNKSNVHDYLGQLSTEDIAARQIVQKVIL